VKNGKKCTCSSQKIFLPCFSNLHTALLASFLPFTEPVQTLETESSRFDFEKIGKPLMTLET
jgi:hypothetical protein